MCFSPKISQPKPKAQAPEPAPLAEEVKSVDIGAGDGSDEGSETKGISDLKVSKTEKEPKSKDAVSRAIRASGVNMG